MIEAATKVIETTAREFGMERREVIDLWGNTVVIEISESKAVRKPTRPNGYAAPPWTGPAGRDLQKLPTRREGQSEHGRHVSQVRTDARSLDGWAGQRHFVSVAGVSEMGEGEG